MKRYVISQLLHSKRKIVSTIWSSSRTKNFRSRRRRRNYKKPAGAGKTETESMKIQTFNSDEETDSLWENSNVTGDSKTDEDDIELQQILFHSGKKLESCSNYAAGKKVLESRCSIIYGAISIVNSIREKGESSCTYCEICDDAKPPKMLKQGSSCRHYYCEECIRNYIGEKINDDINEVKCPVSNCKRILDLESFMPKDFLVRVKDAIRETKVLASPRIIECPFLDCTGELIDDKKGFLIRACPECCKIFCVNCRDSWHLGMSCDAYIINRQLNFFFWGVSRRL